MRKNTKIIKILVSCGSGIATSMLVASHLKSYFDAKNISVAINSCSINEIPYRSEGNDIIVSSAQISFNTNIPIFNAIPILTGIGEQELLGKIEEKVIELSSF